MVMTGLLIMSRARSSGINISVVPAMLTISLSVIMPRRKLFSVLVITTIPILFWSLLLPAIEISTKVGMGSMVGVPAFASLVANLQMTIFSLKFEVSCLHLPTISIQQGRMQSLALQISRTNKPAIEAPEPKLIPLSIVTLNKFKEYLERPKKKRREPKVHRQSGDVANNCCKWT
jgi:hypothetical protein